MTAQQSGYPTAALQYWRRLTTAAIGIGVVVAFTGALGALAVIAVLPEARWFYLYAAIGLTMYASGVVVAAVYKGEYEPTDPAISSLDHIFTLFVMLGVWIVTLLLIGTVIAHLLYAVVGTSLLTAVLIGTLYPAFDIAGNRQVIRSPGGIAAVLTVRMLGVALDNSPPIEEIEAMIPIFTDQPDRLL